MALLPATIPPFVLHRSLGIYIGFVTYVVWPYMENNRVLLRFSLLTILLLWVDGLMGDLLESLMAQNARILHLLESLFGPNARFLRSQISESLAGGTSTVSSSFQVSVKHI